jgi:hypothetical protein
MEIAGDSRAWRYRLHRHASVCHVHNPLGLPDVDAMQRFALVHITTLK